MTDREPDVDRTPAADAVPGRSRSVGFGFWALGAYSAALTVLMGPLILVGRFVRPASDDWCLVPLGRDGGVSAVVGDIYRDQNGRLGNALVNGVVFAHYRVASKIFPGIVLMLLLLVMAVMWALLLRRLTRSTWEALAAGAALSTTTIVVMLLAKPHQYQTLFHAPTIISHTLTVLIAGLIVVVGHLRSRLAWLGVLAVFVVSAFLGTFNEAFTAACLVVVAMAVLARLLVPRALSIWLPLVAGAGLLAGFVSVYYSPGSRNRQQLIKSGSVFDPEVWKVSLDNWWVVADFLLGRHESLLLVIAAAAVGLLVVRFPDGWLRGRTLVAVVVLPLLGGLLASYAATFVLSYAFNGQLRMRERTWPSITMPLLLAAAWLIVLVGAVVGTAVQRRVAARSEGSRPLVTAGLAVGGLAVMLVLSSVSLVNVFGDVKELYHTARVRAVAWDKLDSSVRRQVADGARIVPITPVPIDGLYEPFYPNRRNVFPASCVPGYYGVDQIRPVLVKKRA